MKKLTPSFSVVAVFSFFFLSLVFFPSSSWSEIPQDAQDNYNEGVGFLQNGKFKEAVAPLKRSLEYWPDDGNILWNLGLALSLSKQYEESIVYWKKLNNLSQEDWKVRAKIIQAYQSLGQKEERDREIKALFLQRDQSSGSSLAEADYFCREQFEVEGKSVFAFQYFDPKGDKRVFYRFSIVNEKGIEDYYISLGSYDFVNEISHDLEEISKEERLYHLDGYYSDRHVTYSFMVGKVPPDYDTVRPMLVRILTGVSKPVSESKRDGNSIILK